MLDCRPLAGGLAVINLAPVEPFEELGQHPLFADPDATRQLTTFAQVAMGEGVRSRSAGDLARAYLYYRFALYVTCRLRLVEGLDAATGNIMALRILLREVVLRGTVEERDLTKHPTDEWRLVFKQGVEQTLDRMRTDALSLTVLVRELLESLSDDRAGRLACSRAAQRLAVFAGNEPERRRALQAFCTLAEGAGSSPDALLAVLEELEQTLEIEPVLGIWRTGNPEDEALRLRFEGVWSAYLRLRSALSRPTPALVTALDTAFRHFEYLRFKVLSGGGPIGHVPSFEISSTLQVLGRDLVRSSLEAGDAQNALRVAERLRARALGDVMSRTHYVPYERVPRPFRSRLARHGGNVQSVEPASLREIGLSVYGSGAALLLFLAIDDALAGFLVRPDGELKAWTTPGCRELVSRLASALPYSGSTLDVIRGRLRDLAASVPDTAESTAGALAELWQRLVPKPIEEQLRACTRLVVVPDAELEYVPFCALRMRDERYVTEQFEVLYWPSVTAALATESDYQARLALTTSEAVPCYRGGNLMFAGNNAIMGASTKRAAVYENPGLVLGNPVTATGYLAPGGLPFAAGPLEGAEQEAEIIAARLGVPVLKREGATLDAVCRQGHDARVLHIAAHAVADASDPRQSFVALADEPLTAGELYDSGFGVARRHSLLLYAGLVVLSGCQTGLGRLHPDSVIGLANGFLVAGANSVVSTLWSVRDDATMRLMVRLYELLRAPGSAPDLDAPHATPPESLPSALRAAQLELLRDPATSHPRFWAAFKVTGNARNPLATETH